MPSLYRIVRSAFRLEHRARGAATRALVWMVAARLALQAVPYALLRRAVSSLPRRRAAALSTTLPEYALAIERAARVLPGTPCLARAIAAECLLTRDGRDATLVLGASLDSSRELRAHAWVESEGVTIAGGDEAAHYTPLEAPGRS